jgi:hypothetical protein
VLKVFVYFAFSEAISGVGCGFAALCPCDLGVFALKSDQSSAQIAFQSGESCHNERP